MLSFNQVIGNQGSTDLEKRWLSDVKAGRVAPTFGLSGACCQVRSRLNVHLIESECMEC